MGEVTPAAGQGKINAAFDWITSYFKKAIVFIFWIIFGASLIANGIQIYLHVLTSRALRAAHESDAQHIKEANAARADAEVARRQRQAAGVVIQTNVVIVAQSESNMARVESDYDGASNSLAAFQLYQRRHSISTNKE